MSVQVSYRKQTVFYLILLLIVFSIVEIFAQTIVKQQVFNGCADRLISSGIYSTYSKLDLSSLCRDYYETNVFMSDDRSTIIPFPSQHYKSININSFGLRGEEITPDKSSNVTRIVILGGSTTFGWYALDDKDTIPSYLQKKLNQNKDLTQFEVINGGVPSGSSSFETKFVREILRFQPDVIIVYDGYNEITVPLPEKTPEYKMKLQILFKQMDSYFYTPRAVQKFIHQINSYVFLQINKKPNTVTALYTEDDYVKRADLWEKRWSTVCDELKNKDLKIIVFLQPILGSGHRVLSDYEIKIMNENAKRDVMHYDLLKEKIPMISSHCTLATDISDTFDDINKPIFADLVHTGNYGNEIVAGKIYEKLLPIIYNN